MRSFRLGGIVPDCYRGLQMGNFAVLVCIDLGKGDSACRQFFVILLIGEFSIRSPSGKQVH